MNPIEAAVAPLKSDAIARAEKEALALIARVVKELEAANWNLDVAAPVPRDVWNRDYKAARAKESLFISLTTYVNPTHRWGEPNLRQRKPETEAHFVETSKKIAAEQYDAFVAKLVSKIGKVETATLEGNHVWGQSFLRVVKADGSKENWKTQQIVNVSKLGTLFNQWPTRKVK